VFVRRTQIWAETALNRQKNEVHFAQWFRAPEMTIDDVLGRGAMPLNNGRLLDHQLGAFEGQARAWTSPGEEAG
jgi:hypothetical protein